MITVVYSVTLLKDITHKYSSYLCYSAFQLIRYLICITAKKCLNVCELVEVEVQNVEGPLPSLPAL